MATRAQHSGHVGHDVQSVVGTETHLIAAHEVTKQWRDRTLLAKMATQAKAALQREEMHILADRDYFSALDILACQKAGITATVPHTNTSGPDRKGIPSVLLPAMVVRQPVGPSPVSARAAPSFHPVHRRRARRRAPDAPVRD